VPVLSGESLLSVCELGASRKNEAGNFSIGVSSRLSTGLIFSTAGMFFPGR